MSHPLPPILPESAGKPSIVLPPQFKGGNPAFAFRLPRGDWRVRVGGHVLKPYDLCHPNQVYSAEVNMLCGSAVYELQEGAPLFIMTAVEFARRTQIIGSIQHVTRRACRTCKDAYREGLSPDEKRWLYASQPEMGEILGFEGNRVLADLADGKMQVQPPSRERNPTAMTPPPYRMPTLASRLNDAAGNA